MTNYFVHKSSYIDENSVIGQNTKIWHFCHIMANSVIGDDCIVGQNCFIAGNVVIGSRVKIQNNVSIYDSITIGNDVFIGPSVVFTNVINPRSFIERKHEFRSTIIEDGSSLGANSTILCGIRIGRYSLIGAGSVITKSVKPFAVMVGVPAKQTGWVDRYGNKINLPIQSDSSRSKRVGNFTYTLNGSELNESNN